MAPTSTQQVLLSPAELSYLHTSLSLNPPIRPDSRTPAQFRPLTAETDILPGTNGSARVTFADGTEAIVGVKAEVEKSTEKYTGTHSIPAPSGHDDDDTQQDDRHGDNKWLELSIEIPGMRDDDPMPVFLVSVLTEALLADGDFTKRLYINHRFHWKLYIDILLISQPLSYPLPLISMTAYLALLSARLPRLKSEKDEDPLFDDDWDAAVYLYPRDKDDAVNSRPPVTLLVMAVKDNVIFDPSKEELAVADVVLAVSINDQAKAKASGEEDVDMEEGSKRSLRLLSVRTIDPPSRLTPSGVPNFLNTATGGTAPANEQAAAALETEVEGVWHPPRGGAKRKLISIIVQKCLEPGGVAEEVMDGLEAVDIGS
jgi:exosome complex component RRP42